MKIVKSQGAASPDIPPCVTERRRARQQAQTETHRQAIGTHEQTFAAPHRLGRLCERALNGRQKGTKRRAKGIVPADERRPFGRRSVKRQQTAGKQWINRGQSEAGGKNATDTQKGNNRQAAGKQRTGERQAKDRRQGGSRLSAGRENKC